MATRKKLEEKKRPAGGGGGGAVTQMAGLYDLQETLGKGHYAVVKAARHVFTGERVAVKVIEKSKLDESHHRSLLKEVLCMKLVQHPNVVRLYEVIDTSTKLFLVLELGTGGDLYEMATLKEGGLDEGSARYYFRQIVAAVSYCHKLHVVHRDLKPENVVFFPSKNKGDMGTVKLTDFGFSNKFSPGVKLDTSCGSLAYSAPEILIGDAYDPPKVDIWSLGVILYMLTVGSPPFQEANDSETLTKIMDVKYLMPATLSKDCKSLIHGMLQKLPENRLNVDDVIRHPWMASNDGVAVGVGLPCLQSISKLTVEERNGIIQQMISGNIVGDREVVLMALETDAYNYITSTFYLLAEKLLRERGGGPGGGGVGEVEEEEITASLESLLAGSNNTRRRKSSLRLEEEVEVDHHHNHVRRGLSAGGQRGSVSCSSGLGDLKQLCNYEEEDEEDEDEPRSCSPCYSAPPPPPRRSSSMKLEKMIRSISSTSSDDETGPAGVLSVRRLATSCKSNNVNCKRGDGDSSSSDSATCHQSVPLNNTRVGEGIPVVSSPDQQQEQQTQAQNQQQKEKKKSSKLLNWLKSLSKFKNNNNNNNTKIYKTKSCSELKIKIK